MRAEEPVDCPAGSRQRPLLPEFLIQWKVPPMAGVTGRAGSDCALAAEAVVTSAQLAMSMAAAKRPTLFLTIWRMLTAFPSFPGPSGKRTSLRPHSNLSKDTVGDRPSVDLSCSCNSLADPAVSGGGSARGRTQWEVLPYSTLRLVSQWQW